MTLSMTRPWKHPDSGYYWFRKRVPDDLRNLIGKREERFSLGTRDPSEAKRLHALKLAEVEERWSNLRSGQRPLSSDEIARHAAAIGEHLWRQVEADPYQQLQWNVEIGAILWSARKGELYVDVTQPLPPVDQTRFDQQSVCYGLVDQYFEGKGLSPPAEDRERLARAVTIEVQRVVQNHEAYLRGEQEVRVGGFELLQPRAPAAPLTFERMIEGWLLEKKANKKTEYSWRGVMSELSRVLGHDDARRVTADDLVKWKEELLAKQLAAKTIRDSKLAPVRAIFQWAVDNRKLDMNPAARISIDLKSRPSEKRRGYTDDEARVILRAARTEREAHKRWVPWVCAYTGARIAEVCQLRSEDVKQIDDIWCIAFAAEAGSLKNVNSERVLPVHPALIDEGFLKFVASAGKGPIFPDLARDRFGRPGGNGSKILGRWIKSIGVVDKRLAPNHSWRHRIKTLGRRNGLAVDILDAMTGHGRKTVADTYGEFPPDAMLRELRKIPTLKL
ncbi:site-specific integrase [Bradyrhizobium sp. CCBAU 051011]|uniref:site-specific integrase n=1 Tax=Bradyrhizobium sp. CCBAU 051011 TaxID=858422 RepID=UPI001379D9D3|nr:site-specific integrase [Bradyrhizobium sp. CCBAU 051011]